MCVSCVLISSCYCRLVYVCSHVPVCFCVYFYVQRSCILLSILHSSLSASVFLFYGSSRLSCGLWGHTSITFSVLNLIPLAWLWVSADTQHHSSESINWISCNPSIHPSFQSQVGLSAGFPLPPGASQGVPSPDEIYNSSNIYPWDLLSLGVPRKPQKKIASCSNPWTTRNGFTV